MANPFPQFGYNPVTGEWNDSLRGHYLWSNVNVSEAVPDVMTPSTWSLWWIYHYEANPFEFPGDHPFCGNICGRPYLNLSLISSVYRAIGRDVRKELQGDVIGSTPADLEIPNLPFSPLEVLRISLPGLLRAQWDARRDIQRVVEFAAEIPAWRQSLRAQIEASRRSEDLLKIWSEAIKPTLVRACRMLRSVTMAAADPATILRQELTDLTGEAGANALMSNFSGASHTLASMGPLVGLAEVQKGRMSRQQYLDRYGHRGPHEMEMYLAAPEEDPAWMDTRLQEFSQTSVSVDDLLVKSRAEFETAWQSFETQYPKKKNAIRRKLDGVAALMQNRETVRSEVTRAARLVREYLLRVGLVTGLDEDVFFLSLDETAAVLAGDREPATRVSARRDAYRRVAALPPFPAIIVGHFDPFKWVEDPNRRGDYYLEKPTGPPAVTEKITGFAGAAGCVEGIVRRIDRLEDGNQVQPAEILVTTITNVGWTPLFPRLAAIVTDVGAPLSHAAIVARELGIPAVVGCGNATMLLNTGDRVRVDGGRGVVEILSRSTDPEKMRTSGPTPPVG